MKIFLIILSAIIVLIIGYFIVNIFLDRQDALKDTPTLSDTSTEIYAEDPLATDDTVTSVNDSNEDEAITEEEQKPIKVTITREDCTAQCDGFLADELTYCNEVCGLVIPPDSTDGDCANDDAMLEDYCWKNKAIDKTDFSYCEKIKDGNVFEACKNRITEDIVDAQNQMNKSDL